MKDTVRSRSTGLIQKHPKLFNIFLILALISLVFAGAFLLSDILSFKSNAAQKGPLCAFSLKIPNESKTIIVKPWQEKGVNLIGQLKSFLGIKGTAKDPDKNLTRDKARALLAKNRLAKAKEARLRTENLSIQEIPMGLANSSGALTSVPPSQSENTFTVWSGESEDSSDYPYYYSEGDSYSKDMENDTQSGAVTSNISENQLPWNASVLNDSVSNDAVIDESILKESAMNEPFVNDSVSDGSAIEDSILNNSATNEPIENDSVSNNSAMGDSILNDSAINEPVVNGSISNDSLIGDSILNESAMDKPIANESASNVSGLNGLMENGSVSSGSVSNDPVLNKPIMNESAANESAINGSALNESEVESQIRQSNTNQSQMYTNLSSNTPESLKATDQGSNGTGNNSYPYGSKNTNTSFDKLSSELQSLPESNPSFAGSNSIESFDSTDRDRNGSAASSAPEFDKMGNEISNQDETSNLLTNNDSVQNGTVKNELQNTIPDQKNNTTSDVLTSSSEGIPTNSVADKASSITSGQVIESLNGKSNSPSTGKTLLAANSTSQSQEPKQTYNQSESKPLLDGSSTPLNPLPNNKTEGLQNNVVKNTGTNNKRVSTNSASAQSEQSKIGKTNSASRFRTLKVPTPSWMTKA